jgi:WD40 repeat protein
MGKGWKYHQGIIVKCFHLTLVAFITGFLLTLLGHAGTPVNCIEFHPSEPVAIWNGDQHIVVHSTQSNSTVKTISLPMQRQRDLSFDCQGLWLAVAGGSPGEQGNLAIINWKSGEIELHFEFEGEWLTTVDFSSNGKILAVGSGDSNVSLYRIQTEPFKLIQTHTFNGHAGSVMDAIFDHSGNWLISTGSDRSVKIWNVRENVLHRTFAQHTDVVFDADLRPIEPDQGSLPFYVATASADQTVRIWQPEIGRMVRIVRNHKTDIFTVAYHPSGKWLASGGKDGTIRHINAQSDQILHTKKAHDDWIYTLAFSPNGALMASGDWSGEVVFHQVNDDGTEE